MSRRRRLLFSRKDTSGMWGEIARNDNLDTQSGLRRGLSRAVYLLSAILTGVVLGTTGYFTFTLVSKEPNVADVAAIVKKSMFQVFCGESMGSGVAIKMPLPGDFGTAVWTAAHVVDGCEIGEDIQLVQDDIKLTGELAARDPEQWNPNSTNEADLAVIYVRQEFPSLEPAPQAAVGDWAIVIGNPWGEVNYVSFGVISSVSQSEYKTDAAVNEGNSGGPMIDSGGRVLGLVSYKPVQTEGTVTGTDAVVNRAEGIAAIKRLRLACTVVLNSVRDCPFQY